MGSLEYCAGRSWEVSVGCSSMLSPTNTGGSRTGSSAYDDDGDVVGGDDVTLDSCVMMVGRAMMGVTNDGWRWNLKCGVLCNRG
ncbi:hypothetical protein O3P69_016690 [Scylla paramamosain]|uniref:Uncharacterized protein n=1 Tax=Scylla paramamosain TaxID=85552 RepID=A0AAW0SYL4_SCYPA